MSTSGSKSGDGTRPKLTKQDASVYFDRRYTPTDDERKEMDAIRKDLQICNLGDGQESLVSS